MPLEQTDRSPHVIVVGRLTLFLAAVGLVRIVPEAVAMRDHLTELYSAVLMLDFYLLLTGLVAGIGLIDQPSWGWRPGLLFWGAAPVSSAIIGAGVLERYSPSGSFPEFMTMVPRLSLYGLTLLSAPYAVWVLFRSLRDGRPPLLGRLGWLAAGIVLAGGVAFLMTQHPLR